MHSCTFWLLPGHIKSSEGQEPALPLGGYKSEVR
jgi:hypothetical protein